MSDPRREPIDWLADPQTRHGGLELIRTAIRRGWLEGSAPELAARLRVAARVPGSFVVDTTSQRTDVT
jgi:hypothetical protein